MGEKVKYFLCILFFILAIFITSCKTTEVFVWDPTGVWSVNITYLSYAFSYVETFTFTGTDTSGVVSGHTVYGFLSPQSGTYLKTADFTLTMAFDFWGYGDHLTWSFTGTSSEANPNFMSGSGEWYLNSMLENPLNWTANKTTNLQ